MVDVSEEEKQQMMDHFEQNAKRNFDGSGKTVAVPVSGIKSDGKTVVDGEILISG